MANSGPRSITKQHVLAVEGEDDRKFFDALLRHVAITEVQIEPVGGKDQFKDKLPALLRTPGFRKADGSPFVEHLAIIRDRDEDDAFASVANIVTKAGLSPPLSHGQFSDGSPRVGIFIMPGVTVEGTMLEDLCLKTMEQWTVWRSSLLALPHCPIHQRTCRKPRSRCSRHMCFWLRSRKP